MAPSPRKPTVAERLGRALGVSRPGVFFFRYVFTPLDKATYRLTKGKRGLSPVSMTTALLTTTGRNSGRAITTPVLLVPDGDDHVVVGSNYGRNRHPAWTFNLMADPRAEVQKGSHRWTVIATRLTEAEVEAIWPRLVRMWPGWTTYRKITDRDFRMFRLRAISGGGAPEPRSVSLRSGRDGEEGRSDQAGDDRAHEHS